MLIRFEGNWMVENWAKFRTFYPRKISWGMGEMSKSGFQVLIYFWRGAAARAEGFNASPGQFGGGSTVPASSQSWVDWTIPIFGRHRPITGAPQVCCRHIRYNVPFGKQSHLKRKLWPVFQRAILSWLVLRGGWTEQYIKFGENI